MCGVRKLELFVKEECGPCKHLGMLSCNWSKILLIWILCYNMNHSLSPISLTNVSSNKVLPHSECILFWLEWNCTCYQLTKQCNFVFFDKQLSTNVALAEECKDTQKSGEHFLPKLLIMRTCFWLEQTYLQSTSLMNASIAWHDYQVTWNKFLIE
jgi:hypothetical protein